MMLLNLSKKKLVLYSSETVIKEDLTNKRNVIWLNSILLQLQNKQRVNLNLQKSHNKMQIFLKIADTYFKR